MVVSFAEIAKVVYCSIASIKFCVSEFYMSTEEQHFTMQKMFNE